MNQFRWRGVLVLPALLVLCPAAWAQQNTAHIGYVYPAGGRQGSTFSVVVGGQFLQGVSSVHFSGTGVRAAVTEYIKPMSPKEALELRDQLKALLDKKLGITPQQSLTSSSLKPGLTTGGRKKLGITSQQPFAPSSPNSTPTQIGSSQPGLTIRQPVAPASSNPAYATDGARQIGVTSQSGIAPSPSKPVWTAEDEKLLAEIKKKLANYVRKPSSPAIAENVTIQISVAADADPGVREIRVGVPAGLTNPLVFCVGQLPEFNKAPAKPTGQAKKNQDSGIGKLAGRLKPSETVITLPCVVNGQIAPGGVDQYRFKAARGQKLVIAAGARELIPYLADAVPGWFQAALTLYDPNGQEVAYSDHFRFHQDPVLYYEVPDDGDYTIEIRDSIYRGREDFVYRITIGELPFITGIYPLGGQAGQQTTVELQGWNLPATQLTMDARDKAPGVYLLTAPGGAVQSNREPFMVDTLPECAEQDLHDQRAAAQRITLPIVVNGRIDRPGDRDVFCFEGRSGEEITAEVYARRLDSPLDSVLKLTDTIGKQIAFNDDHKDGSYGVLTQDADSWISATLPADGTYYLYLTDAQHKGGPEYSYRLRVSHPHPDFELRIVPSGINARPGGIVPVTVHAIRRDGFSGEITLSLKDAPAGFSISGGRIPANQDQVPLTLSVPPTPRDQPVNLSLVGSAMIQGHRVVRVGVPAEDMMQAFLYRHLVPTQELDVSVSARFRGGAGARAGAIRILGFTPVQIPSGGTARVRVGIPARLLDRVELELNDPPDGITIRRVVPGLIGCEIVLQSDATKVKPGLSGNLIVNLFAKIALPAAVTPTPTSPTPTPTTTPAAKAKNNRVKVPIGVLPAIPFDVVGTVAARQALL